VGRRTLYVFDPSVRACVRGRAKAFSDRFIVVFYSVYRIRLSELSDLSLSRPTVTTSFSRNCTKTRSDAVTNWQFGAVVSSRSRDDADVYIALSVILLSKSNQQGQHLPVYF